MRTLHNQIAEIVADSTRTWLDVGPYRVLINRTAEGLIVDVYPADVDSTEPLATAWTHDNELTQ
jgi:hypothetical protein